MTSVVVGLTSVFQTIQAKSNFYTTCQPPRVFQPVEECDCSGGRTEPDCMALQLPARY